MKKIILFSIISLASFNITHSSEIAQLLCKKANEDYSDPLELQKYYNIMQFLLFNDAENVISIKKLPEKAVRKKQFKVNKHKNRHIYRFSDRRATKRNKHL